MKATSNGKRVKDGRPKTPKQRQPELEGVEEVHFPQVTGKVIASAKFWGHGVDITFILDFTDGTVLIVDCYPEIRTTTSADLSDWTTGAPRGSTRWGRVMQLGGK